MQTWKVTHQGMEGREAEIWELYQKNDFFSWAFAPIFYLFYLGMDLEHLSTCSSAQLPVPSLPHMVQERKGDATLQMGNGADTHEGAGRIKDIT